MRRVYLEEYDKGVLRRTVNEFLSFGYSIAGGIIRKVNGASLYTIIVTKA